MGRRQPREGEGEDPEKAREKVQAKAENIRQQEKSVRRTKAIVAKEAKVKEEVVDEVVEVEEEQTVEETVKEEVEEKVVEEKALGAGRWLRFFLGSEGGGVHPRPAMGPSRPSWPPAPKPPPPPLGPPGESDLDSPLFYAPCASRNVGRGEVGMGGQRGFHRDKPLRVGRGFQGSGGGNRSCPGRSGGSRPPLEKRG